MTIRQNSIPVDTTLMDMGDSFPIQDMLIKSPCCLRPDTKRPCPLLDSHKNNPYCESCGFLNPDQPIHTEAELYEAIRVGLPETALNVPRTNELKRDRDYGLVCVWCGKGIPRSLYCREHGKVIRRRLLIWERDHGKGSVPPVRWLHQPVVKNGGKALI